MVGTPGEARALADVDLARLIASPGRASLAENELCRRFAPRVRLYGLRHLRDEAAADDLVQRVLTLTIEKLRAGAVTEPERIASFVLGAARLTASTIRRRERREEPVPGDELDVEAAEAASPLLLSRERLERCLEALAERERSVLLLAFFHDRTAPEIGASLSLSEGNVRVIRHRAIARVRDCMGAGEEEA